jgi:hypothetical protein
MPNDNWYSKQALILTPPSPPDEIDGSQMTPLRGWRGYLLTGRGTLKGGIGNEWESARMTAECCFYHHPVAEHLTDCDCGIYGITDQGAAKGHFSHPIMSYPIIAQVAAYGDIAIGSEGWWKATEVEIEQMFVIRYRKGEARLRSTYIDWTSTASDLQARYNVPVRVVDSLSAVFIYDEPADGSEPSNTA